MQRQLFERAVVRLITAWLLALAVTLMIYHGADFNTKDFAGESWLLVGGMTAAFFLVLNAVGLLRASIHRDYLLLQVVALLTASVCLIQQTRNFYLYLGLTALLLGSGYLILANDRFPVILPKLSTKWLRVSVGVLAGAAFAFLALLTVFRYLSYFSPNFDFGIFSNMFYNMRENLSMTVSCERDRLLSHLAVHISPIYYLMLPFYALVPTPATLLVVQAAIVLSGVFPLYRLARHAGLKNWLVLSLCAVYLIYPALWGGCFYDLHENKFLTVLLLWMFYFYETKKMPLVYLFAGLTLLVKEDAAIYTAAAALYFFFGRRDRKHGAVLFGVSVVYFAAAVLLLSRFGTGALMHRYSNISDDGMFGILKACITNPLRVLAACFKADKLEYLLKMLLPLLCVPLMTRKASRFFLFIPMILINLITDYTYQYSIDFQYTYGVTAMLFYLTVLNLADMPVKKQHLLLSGAVVSASLLYLSVVSPRYDLIRHYRSNAETRQVIRSAMALIPDDASVQADTFFVAHLAQRREIYEYPSKHTTEYIVFDLRYGDSEKKLREIDIWIRSDGYTLVTMQENYIAVLYRPAAP